MKSWRIQPCTYKTLAAIYNVTVRVLRTHLKPFEEKIGVKNGHNFTVKQIITIIENYSLPLDVEVIYPEPIPVAKRQGSL